MVNCVSRCTSVVSSVHHTQKSPILQCCGDFKPNGVRCFCFYLQCCGFFFDLSKTSFNMHVHTMTVFNLSLVTKCSLADQSCPLNLQYAPTANLKLFSTNNLTSNLTSALPSRTQPSVPRMRKLATWRNWELHNLSTRCNRLIQ